MKETDEETDGVMSQRFYLRPSSFLRQCSGHFLSTALIDRAPAQSGPEIPLGYTIAVRAWPLSSVLHRAAQMVV